MSYREIIVLDTLSSMGNVSCFTCTYMYNMGQTISMYCEEKYAKKNIINISLLSAVLQFIFCVQVQQRLNEFLKLKHSSRVREAMDSQRPLGLLKGALKKRKKKPSGIVSCVWGLLSTHHPPFLCFELLSICHPPFCCLDYSKSLADNMQCTNTPFIYPEVEPAIMLNVIYFMCFGKSYRAKVGCA